MAVTKEKLYNDTQKRLAKLTKALSHPARIAIIQLLAQRESCICGDITDELPLAQSTVSQHLKALKKVGLIQGQIDGVRTCYCLDEKGVAGLQEFLGPFLNDIQLQTKDQCC